jgi:hypothetical protein
MKVIIKCIFFLFLVFPFASYCAEDQLAPKSKVEADKVSNPLASLSKVVVLVHPYALPDADYLQAMQGFQERIILFNEDYPIPGSLPLDDASWNQGSYYSEQFINDFFHRSPRPSPPRGEGATGSNMSSIKRPH